MTYMHTTHAHANTLKWSQRPQRYDMVNQPPLKDSTQRHEQNQIQNTGDNCMLTVANERWKNE